MDEKEKISLSEDLKHWRAERPDEWTMDRFIGKAEALEIFAQKNEEAPETKPVICEKCGNDMSVDKREGGCVANYCPWCNTRKPKTI